MRRLLGFAIGAGFVVAACQLFVAIDDEKGVPPPPEQDRCTHLRPPPEDPDATPKGTPDLDPLFFAAQNFVITPKAPADLPGFDLDDFCTGIDGSITSAGSCKKTATSENNDLDGGLDNSFGRIVQGLPLEDDYGGRLLNNNAKKGVFDIIIQITGYNGLAYDDDVKLAAISGTRPNHAADAGFIPAVFDGTESWDFYNVTLSPGIGPPTSAETLTGYVVDHTLVIPDGRLEVELLAGLVFRFARVRISANLVPAGTGFRLSHFVAGGVVGSLDAIDFIRNVRLPGQEDAGCGNPFSELIRKSICDSRDVRTDFDASLPCDSLTFGFSFDGVPTSLGQHLLSAPPTDCPRLTGSGCD